MTKKPFVPVLSLLRGIASLGVCGIHINYGLSLTQYHTFSKLIGFGQLGVQIFFVISGFVIPYSLYNAQYKLSNFFEFIIKRSCRIDPPYLISIFLGVGLSLFSVFHNIGFVEFLLHCIYLIPFSHYTWYNGVFWTLGIEFQYYLLMGLVFTFISNGNSFVVCFFLCLICYLGHRIEIGYFFGKKDDFFIFNHIHYFVLGILVYLYKIDRIKLLNVHLILFAILIYLSLSISFTTGIIGYATYLTILHINFTHRFSDFFGKISYSLYLIHLPVGGLAIFWLHYLAISDVSIFCLTMVICIAFATFYQWVVENPAIELARKIKFKNAKN